MDNVKQRSLAQNRYRWSVIVKYYQDWLNLAIAAHNKDTGASVPMLSPENVDFYIKQKVWGLIKEVAMPFGVLTVELPLRTVGVSTFEERMEQARAYAAQELHFEIPLPHECIDDLKTQYASNLERLNP